MDTLDTNEPAVPLEYPWPTDLLVCAATWMELRSWWPREDNRGMLGEGSMAYSPILSYFVTGVGIPATLGSLLGLLQQVRPARLLSIGIAGAYPGSGLNIGDIVIGTSEVYGDVGFQLPSDDGPFDFQSIQASPFLKQMPLAYALYAQPMELRADFEPVANTSYQVKHGRGCTVNTCTGTEHLGHLRERMFAAHFETMEGACVAQCGQAQFRNTPVSEIRAISNIAGTRDMQPDNIRLAIANLRDYLQKSIEH